MPRKAVTGAASSKSFRKGQSPTPSAGSSERGRRRSEVENVLNELMECGFQPHNTSTATASQPDSHPRNAGAKTDPSALQTSGLAYSSTHPYTSGYGALVPPFLSGMLAMHLLQIGLPSIKYYLGAFGALLKWSLIWGTIIGGVSIYAGAFSAGEVMAFVEKAGAGYFRAPEAVNTEKVAEAELQFRPPVPSKSKSEPISPGPKKEASVTNVRAFQVHKRRLFGSGSTHTGSSDMIARSEGKSPSDLSSPSLVNDTAEPQARMRRAFTEGAPREDQSFVERPRRRSEFVSARALGTGGPPDDVNPRNWRTHSRRQSHDTAASEDLPFSFEMKMKDSDNYSIGRSDTTSTKHSVLGTRANYSKFLANVDH